MKKIIKESELRELIAKKITEAIENLQPQLSVDNCVSELEYATEGLYGDYGPRVLVAALKKYAKKIIGNINPSQKSSRVVEYCTEDLERYTKELYKKYGNTVFTEALIKYSKEISGVK